MLGHIIDFRSDSVTQPTKEMRKAMYSAEVGYDVFREDPTVERLEKTIAEKTNMEAGLFIPTGTMGNQLSLLTWTQRGEEIILSHDSHILEYEVGAASVLSSVGYRVVNTSDSILRKKDIQKLVRPYSDDIHVPKTGLVCVENALGRGSVVPIESMKEVYEEAKKYNLPVHLDGARVFNAATALGKDISEIAQYADSMAIHLSKGLCAPVGGVLVGPKEFIAKARRNRHMLGGGMSHPGILAAAGIVAIEKMTSRIQEDHDNANHLRSRLEEFDIFSVDYSRADINLVFFRWNCEDETLLHSLPTKLDKFGIKISPCNQGIFRYVTHNDISHEDIDYTVDVMHRIIDDKS